MSNQSTQYDIVIVTEIEGQEQTHIFEAQFMANVMDVMIAMENDSVFGLHDKLMHNTFFRPSEVSKIQFNLVVSHTRSA